MNIFKCNLERKFLSAKWGTFCSNLYGLCLGDWLSAVVVSTIICHGCLLCQLGMVYWSHWGTHCTCLETSKYDDVMRWKCSLHYWWFVRRIYWWEVYYPHKGPVMQGFDYSFVVMLNKLLNKQVSCQWFADCLSSRCAGPLNWVWRRLRLYYCDGNFHFT